MEKLIGITIKVDEERYNKFKKLCIEEDININDKIINIIKGYLETKYKREKLGEDVRNNPYGVGKYIIDTDTNIVKSLKARIPEALHKNLKLSCVEERITISDVLRLIIDYYVFKTNV